MATEVIIDAMPFDAQEIIDPQTQEVSYDRVSVAADFARWMKTYFSNGILVDSSAVLGTQFQVTSSGLTITVQPGSGVINGRTGWMTNSASLTVASGGSTDRYDRVVLELNIPDDRQMSVKVVTGTTSAPALIRTDDVYQLSLAVVKVAARSASAVVTDTRADDSVCGISKIKYVSNTAGNIGVSETTRVAYGLSSEEANTDKALQKAISGDLSVKSFNGHKGEVDYLENRIKSYASVSENRVYSNLTGHNFFPITIQTGDANAKHIRLYISASHRKSGFKGLFPDGMLGNYVTTDDAFRGAIIDLFKYEDDSVGADVLAPFFGSNVDSTSIAVLWKKYIRDVSNEEHLLVASNGGADFGVGALVDNVDDLVRRASSSAHASLNFVSWDSQGNIELSIYTEAAGTHSVVTNYTITAAVMDY